MQFLLCYHRYSSQVCVDISCTGTGGRFVQRFAGWPVSLERIDDGNIENREQALAG